MQPNINFQLRESKISNEKFYTAYVLNRGTYNLDGLVKKIIDLGSSLTEVDVRGTITFLKEAIKNILLEGGKVKIDDFLTFSPSIKGKFRDDKGIFNPNEHKVEMKIRTTELFNKSLTNNAVLTKHGIREIKPEIINIIDLATKEENSVLTKMSDAKIRGNRLFFDNNDPAQGIFIITWSGIEHKVNYNDKPSHREMKFIVPNIDTNGERVYIEVRSAMGTKEIRAGRTRFSLELR